MLLAVRQILGDSASIDEIRIQATAMWSLAHGLATLLIDGPLERKIGKISDRRALVRSVAQRAAEGFRYVE
ncbi:MAG: WHG domain-containing protein [Actinobacteria bacterium]|nr:WHG domain-containing protein [Actinomycetota bacterium]